MNKRQYSLKYGIIFTLCMCFVLAFVVVSTGAWLTSSRKTSGTISMASLNVILINNTSTKTDLGGKTTDTGEGEYGAELAFSTTAGNEQLYVYNKDSAAAYIRFKVDSDYADYITISTMAGANYGWEESNGYFYLSSTSGARKSLAGGAYTDLAISYTLRELPDGAIDSNDQFTFYIVLEAVQALNMTAAGLTSVGWTNLPTGW